MIVVDGSSIIDIFTDFVKNSKIMYNFKVVNDTLTVQVLDDFTVEKNIKCVNTDNATVDMSVYITGIVHALEAKTPIHLIFSENSLVVEQGTFRFTCVREFEERRNYKSYASEEFKQIYTNRLMYLVGCSTTMSTLTTELKIGMPDPVFVNDKYYIILDNAAFIENMKIDDCCISRDILKRVAYLFKDNAKYFIDEETSTMIVMSDPLTFYIPLSNYNINAQEIKSVDKVLANLTKISTINISRWSERLKVIAQVFEKKKVELTIGKDAFLVTATDNSSRISIGDNFEDYINAISITAGCLKVIVTLFKENSEVEILRGGSNCLCLRSGEKSLLISGVLY